MIQQTMFHHDFFIKVLEIPSECQTVWIKTKPDKITPDLGLNCLQRYMQTVCNGTCTSRQKINSFGIICSLGKVKLSLDKYLMAIYLSLCKYQLLLFTPLISQKGFSIPC